MSSLSMKDLLANAGFKGTEESQVPEDDNKHVSESRRMKDIIKRPDAEVELLSLAIEDREIVKTQKDPTDDLVVLQRTFAKGAFNTESLASGFTGGYIVQDKDTGECWYAHDKHCLDANFIYRDDLTITEVHTSEEAVKVYTELMSQYNLGLIPNKTKYILDDPGSESYELYCDSNYPAQKYGKATPTGMFVHRYPNRFHRDMAILELDALYTNSSNKEAGKLIKREFKPHEAIIISDGAWMRNTSSYCYFYIDATSVLKQCEGVIPSEPDQAVLISEINGAYYALLQCYARKKKKISYYYDNTSIVNVFKNRKTEYIEEIKRYKDFCEKISSEGYQVEFIELHPKTDEAKDKLNKALTYFHNTCDDECRKMSTIFTKDYKSYVGNANASGTTYTAVKEQFKPHGRPGQSKGYGNKPYNNNRR